MPLLHSYAFMACTVAALTRFKLALLLIKCNVRLLRSAVWPWLLPHVCTVCRLALALVRTIDEETDFFFPYLLYFRARFASTVMRARSAKLWNMCLISWRS